MAVVIEPLAPTLVDVGVVGVAPNDGKLNVINSKPSPRSK